MVQAKPRIGFIFLSADVQPGKDRVYLAGLEFVAVKDYDGGVAAATALVKEGVQAIELCAGFGNIGVSKIVEAVKGTPVGVVRFDGHPLMQGKTGDQRFKLTP